MKAVEEFQAIMDKAGIVHFRAEEVFFRGASDKRLGLNTDPPRKLWPRIIPTLIVADKARAALGRPLRINSAYRSPAYNKAISGASKSQHVEFTALDLSTNNPRQLFKVLAKMRDAGEFTGGIGLYPTFVHVDTRGSNATW